METGSSRELARFFYSMIFRKMKITSLCLLNQSLYICLITPENKTILENFVYTLDWVIYVLFTFSVIYLFIFSVASLLRKPQKPSVAKEYRRIAILIAAYREDNVIQDTVKACLAQEYPHEKFDIVVISDHMTAETNAVLKTYPIKLLQVDFEKSTNTKSLKAALSYLEQDHYNIALILDADNYVKTTYLADINDAFAQSGVEVVQTHRVAKNLNTDMAYLDGISEEINNSIFRMGHINLGMSAALIGSGMAFHYPIFYAAMMDNQSLGGFDRVLEMKLLYNRVFFHYLPDTYVYDEKIQKSESFFLQRRRWLSAQYYSLFEFARKLPIAILQRKWDFCDKLYQQASFSRILLLGLIFVFAIFLSFATPALAYKWWITFGVLLMALALAIPRRLWTVRMIKAIMLVPYSFILMFANLFYIKSANKKFIHTTHGVDNK